MLGLDLIALGEVLGFGHRYPLTCRDTYTTDLSLSEPVSSSGARYLVNLSQFCGREIELIEHPAFDCL